MDAKIKNPAFIWLTSPESTNLITVSKNKPNSVFFLPSAITKVSSNHKVTSWIGSSSDVNASSVYGYATTNDKHSINYFKRFGFLLRTFLWRSTTL